jgi:hypothetical protein
MKIRGNLININTGCSFAIEYLIPISAAKVPDIPTIARTK